MSSPTNEAAEAFRKLKDASKNDKKKKTTAVIAGSKKISSKESSVRSTKSKPVRSAKTKKKWVLPKPCLREGRNSDRKIRSIEIPLKFEEMRLDAKSKNLSVGDLIMYALKEHKERMLDFARKGEIFPYRSNEPKIRWSPTLTNEETQEIDELITELGIALQPKPSRKKLVTELLHCCLE